MKHTDTQLIILSSASQRQDGLATLPETLKGSAAKAAVTKLLGLGLLKEVRVKRDQPAWRSDEEEKPLGLKITKAGSAAMAVEDEPAEEGQANEAEGSAKKQGAKSASEPRSGSKQAQIIALMQRKSGATLEDMVAATGWLAHTTRAALTRLRQAGHILDKAKRETGGTVYHIAAPSNAIRSRKAP
jgi:hypothetical protein